MRASVCVYIGEALASYGFGHGHPFGPDRLDAFWSRAQRVGLDARVRQHDPVIAGREMLEHFHTPAYVDRVIEQCGGHYEPTQADRETGIRRYWIAAPAGDR